MAAATHFYSTVPSLSASTARTPIKHAPQRKIDRSLSAIALLCLGAVGAALVAQHVFDMQPCAFCVLQRLVFVAIAATCMAGMILRSGVARAWTYAVVQVLALCGIAAGLWQHFVAAATDSCNLTLADRIVTMTGLDALVPEVFQARATCSEAAVSILGIPFEFYSIALLVGFAVTLLGAGKPPDQARSAT